MAAPEFWPEFAGFPKVIQASTGQHLKFGVSELKVDVGPGYRVYYTLKRQELIVLLCGGDKSRQSRDIELAYKLVRDLEN